MNHIECVICTNVEDLSSQYMYICTYVCTYSRYVYAYSFIILADSQFHSWNAQCPNHIMNNAADCVSLKGLLTSISRINKILYK